MITLALCLAIGFPVGCYTARVRRGRPFWQPLAVGTLITVALVLLAEAMLGGAT